MEGTSTGEHGVGIGKKEYLYEELGVGTVDLMKKIKSAYNFDDGMHLLKAMISRSPRID